MGRGKLQMFLGQTRSAIWVIVQPPKKNVFQVAHEELHVSKDIKPCDSCLSVFPLGFAHFTQRLKISTAVKGGK